MKAISKCKKDFRTIDCGENIHVLLFKNKYDMGMSFVRIQEFYESPKFSNKIFDLEDFIDWYTLKYSEMRGFSYPFDWGGYNLPGKVIDKWLCNIGRAIVPIESKTKLTNKQFDNLCFETTRDRAKELLRTREYAILQPYLDNRESLRSKYLIGISMDISGIRETIRHELCHAEFNVNREYKNKAIRVVREMPEEERSILIKWLGAKGYHSRVFIDEIQAYMSTRDSNNKMNFLNLPFSEKENPFKNLYDQFIKGKEISAIGKINDIFAKENIKV